MGISCYGYLMLWVSHVMGISWSGRTVVSQQRGRLPAITVTAAAAPMRRHPD